MINKLATFLLIVGLVGCASQNGSIRNISCTKEEWKAYINRDNYIEPSYLKRTFEEVSFVISCHNGKIYSTYKPYFDKQKNGLGRIVFKFTIHPSGDVTDVSIVSSEFDNPEFTEKLVNEISKFRFVSKDVEKTVITFPIDFRGKAPSTMF